MPRLSRRVPKFSVHKRSGQAFVRLNGKQIPLGAGDSIVSRREYDRVIGLWLANNRQLPEDWKVSKARKSAKCQKPKESSSPSPAPMETTVTEVLLAYLPFARQYYSKPDAVTGKRSPTRTFEQMKQVARELQEHYGRHAVAEFGPAELVALRVRFVRELNWGRKHTNEMVKRIVAMFQFASERLDVPIFVWQTLKTVKSLHKGRPLFTYEGQIVADEAGLPIIPREGVIPPPVDDETVRRTLEMLPAVVADMVRFQRATGCRPGEVCHLRPKEIDRSGDVWIYRPPSSKTDHVECDRRVIAIGATAQAILAPYLLRGPEEFCFSPADSEKKRRSARAAERKTPLSCGNIRGSNRKTAPIRKLGNHYKATAYAKAVHRAVARVNAEAERVGEPVIERWSPNQLRKSHALEVRENEGLGLDHAQVALGHQQRETTERFYARISANEKAVEVARRIG